MAARAVRIILPESFIPEHHLSHSTVSVLLHAGPVFLYGGLHLSRFFFVLRRFRRAVGSVSPPLGKVDQHANQLFSGKRTVKRLGPELVRRFFKSTGRIHRLYVRNRHDAVLLHQVADAFQAVAMPAQTTARASCVPPGGCKAGAGFWLLRLVKNAYAQILNAVRLPIRPVSEDCPADRTNANI